MAGAPPTIVPPAVPPPVGSDLSPVTSSPVSFTGGRPKLGPRRQSRFTEEPMTAATPASSVSALPSFDIDPHGWDQHHPAARNFSNISTVNSIHDNNSNLNHSTSINHVGSFSAPSSYAPHAEETNAHTKEDLAVAIRGLLRTVNSILHAVPCLLLLYIMGSSLKALRSEWVDRRSVQALILLAITILDCLLDALVLFLIRRPWANWQLFVRSFFGVLYLASFFVYIGFGSRVFQEGYTYWNLSSGSGGAVPFVYVLMWWLAVWNILHPIISRWTTLKTFFTRNNKSKNTATRNQNSGINQIRRPSCFSEQRPTSFNPRISTVGTEGTVSMVSLTWRRWVSRTRSSHFSRGEFDVEGQQRSRRGTVDEDCCHGGVPLDEHAHEHEQPISCGALVSATDITLKGDDHHYDDDDDEDDYDDKDADGDRDYDEKKRKITTAAGGGSLVQQRSLSRLDGRESDDDEFEEEKGDYEKSGNAKKEEEGRSSFGAGKMMSKDVGQ